MNQDQPFSLTRLLLVAIFGRLFLRFEGKTFIEEQIRMVRLNIETTMDSLSENEDRLSEANAESEPTEESKTRREAAQIAVDDSREALEAHRKMLENLAYKRELLNRI